MINNNTFNNLLIDYLIKNNILRDCARNIKVAEKNILLNKKIVNKAVRKNINYKYTYKQIKKYSIIKNEKVHDFYIENYITSFTLMNNDETKYDFNPKYHVNKEYMERYCDEIFISELLRNPKLSEFICDVYQINILDIENVLNNEKVFALNEKNNNRIYS